MSNVKRLSKEERRSRRIRRGICIGAIVALLLTAGVLLLRRQVTQSFASGKQEILSAEVTTGSISATVSGSGSLVSADVTEVTVPAGVSIKKVYAEAGDQIKEGDILASVDTSSVLSVLSETQQKLDELDEHLSDAEDMEADSTIKTALKGRVKEISAA